MKKAISYVRYSSKEQAKGDSFRRQLKAAEDYCAAHGLVLDDTVLDSGVSAFKGANATVGALSNLIKDVDAGRIPKGTTLIIESLDRLSRMEVDKALLLLMELVNGKELIVVTLSDNQTYRKGQMDMLPLMTSLVVMSRAHEESAMKSRRLGAVWSKKKEQARDGQLMSVRVPTWLVVEGKACIVVEEKAEAVRKAFELLASGFGFGAAIRRLNQAGILAPSGRPWAPTSLKRLVETQAVIGHYQPHTTKGGTRVPVGDIIKGYYPAVIDEDLYWKVRHKHKLNNGSNGVRNDVVGNLFSGIAVCALCGSTMRYFDKCAQVGGKYLACRDRVEARGCDLPYMLYDQIERVVLMWLHYEGVNLMTPKASEIDFDALVSRLDENLKEQERVAEAIAKVGFIEAIQNQLTRLSTEATDLRGRLQERPIATDTRQEFEELVDSVKSPDGRRLLIRQMKRLGVSLKVGANSLEVVDKVIFTRSYLRGYWRWEGSNNQTLVFPLVSYPQRIKGLKPNWVNYKERQDVKPQGEYWDQVVSYPSHTRLLDELLDEE